MSPKLVLRDILRRRTIRVAFGAKQTSEAGKTGDTECDCSAAGQLKSAGAIFRPSRIRVLPNKMTWLTPGG